MLHIPFDFSDPVSGSRVRAHAVTDAFTARFGNVSILTKVPGRNYRNGIREFIRTTDLSTLAYCYSEPGTMPLHEADHLLYRALRNAGVPLGVFYRDMCWKYGIWNPAWPAERIRRSTARYMKDISLYRETADILYCPTASFADQLPVSVRKELLPPAGRPGNVPAAPQWDRTGVIYVGGLNKRFGSRILVETMALVNRATRCPFTIVTRMDELNSEDAAVTPDDLRQPWLRTVDSSEADLATLYRQHSLAIIPRERNAYNDLAFPVKLMEYLSFGLPVIATGCTEQAAFIETHGVGICGGTPKELAQGILKLTGDENAYGEMAGRVRERFLGYDTWQHRVATIDADLTAVVKRPRGTAGRVLNAVKRIVCG